MDLSPAPAQDSSMKECGNESHPLTLSGGANIWHYRLSCSDLGILVPRPALQAVTLHFHTVKTPMPNQQEAEHYELRIKGHLDDHWAEWFENLKLTRAGDGTTALAGPIADQAALHSLLNKIRDLGMVLISVKVLGPTHIQPASDD
ncbi:hypothetical protein [Arthrobacter sp. D3-16]